MIIQGEYQGLPTKCEHCLALGHDTTKCVTTQVAKLVNLHKETENSPDPGWSTVLAKGKRKVGNQDPIEEDMEGKLASSSEEEAANPSQNICQDLSENNSPTDMVIVTSSEKQATTLDKNITTPADATNTEDGLAKIKQHLLDITKLALPGETNLLEKVENLKTDVNSPRATPDAYLASSTTSKSSGKGKSQKKKKR